MVCEGLLNYFGTSSEEIAEKTKQYYLLRNCPLKLICTQNPGHIIYELGTVIHGCFSVFYRKRPFCFCLNSFVVITLLKDAGIEILDTYID